jgi:repressor LexA
MSNSIKLIRKKIGLSQKEVAAALQVTQGAVSSWESGRYEPDTQTLKRLSDLFGVTIDEILGVPEDKPAPAWKTVDPAEFPPKQTSSAPLPDLFHTVRIPILGSVRAGFDWLAQQEIVGYVEVEEALVTRFPDVFALYVKGDSMEPEIRHNDIAICVPRPQVDNNAIAIICINGDEGTIKRVRFEDGGLTVIPSNHSYPPRHYSPREVESTPVTIQALVIETRRRYVP